MKIKKIKEKIFKFYKKRKQLVWIGGAVLVALAAVLVIFLPRDDEVPENVQYAQVISGSITEGIEEMGYVEAQPSAVITWQSEGIVDDYDLEIGDIVKKDDVLMELELSSWPDESLQAKSALLDAQVELQNLINTDSDLLAAMQILSDAEWNLIDKKADRDAWNYGGSSDDRIDAVLARYNETDRLQWEAEAEYEELKKTLDEDDPALVEAYDALQDATEEHYTYLRAINQILGTPYTLQVETDFIEYEQAKDDVAQARAEYNRLVDDSQEVRAAEANVQAYQNTINEARIIAPFDGTGTEISTLPGEMIRDGTQAVQLDNLENLVVNVNVSEIDISKVEIGQAVVITFDALPYKEYSGFVSDVSSAGTDEDGIVQFRVTATIEDADESVKPGFTAVISIITSQVDDALLVPSQALSGRNGDNMVVVVSEDGTTKKVMVEVGTSSEAFTEIINGDIEEGDQLMVVVNASEDTFGGGFGMMGGMRQITGGGGGRPPD
jgi:HlyD family secretion protein